MSDKIVIRKSRDGHRFPWAAHFPCCPYMNSGTGHAWHTWQATMAQVERHLLSERHGDLR